MGAARGALVVRPIITALLVLCQVKGIQCFRNWTEPSTLVVGTVLSLSSSAGNGANSNHYASTQILSGYQFWVEYANKDGGIKVGDERLRVELRFYDDEGDASRVAELFEKLVMEDGVDVLLGGGERGTGAMAKVGKKHGLLSIACCTGLEEQLLGYPLLFGISADVKIGISDVLSEVSRIHGLKRVAIVSGQGPNQKMRQQVQDLGLNVVFEQSNVAQELPPARSSFLNLMAAHEPDILLGLSLREEDSILLLQEKGLIRGWDCPQRAINPCLLESASIKLIVLDGAETPTFLSAAKGYSDGVVSIHQWHATNNFSDPYFGTSVALNELWAGRGDYGAGQDLSDQAATAIAAGTMLRLGLESAGRMEMEAVRLALATLDTDTFVGRLKLDAHRRNVGHRPVTSQWRCSEDGCSNQLVRPLEGGVAIRLQPPCGVGVLRQQGQGQRGGSDSECVACLRADAAWVGAALAAGGQQAERIREACEALREPVLVGALVWKGAEQVADAMRRALQTRGGGADELAAMGVRVEVMQADAAAPGESARAWRAREELRFAAAGVAAVVVDTLAASAREGGAQDAAAAMEGGVAVRMRGMTVSMEPSAALQGRALAVLVAEMGWRSVELVGCQAAVFRAMAAEFKREARHQDVEVLREVELVDDEEEDAPSLSRRGDDGDEDDEEGLALRESVRAQLDFSGSGCVSRIVVLCLDAPRAEAVAQVLRLSGRPQEYVLLGPHSLTRIRSPLHGMLATTLSPPFQPEDPSHHVGASDTWTQPGPCANLNADEAWALAAHAEAAAAADAAAVIGELLHATLLPNATFARDRRALAEALVAVDLLGLTGHVSFDAAGKRMGGRMGVVNWDGQASEWHQIAVWDTANAPVLAKLGNASSRLEWIQSLTWPGATHPDELCPCEVWTRMPSGHVFVDCAWSAAAVGVTALCSVVLVLCVCCACRGVWKDFDRDEEAQSVMKEIEKLRSELGLRMRNGFLLSWERRSLLGRLLGRQAVDLERKQMEALAQLRLHMPFEITQLDALYSWVSDLDAAAAADEEAGLLLREASDSVEGARMLHLNWRYKRLCQMVLACATELLDPASTVQEEAKPKPWHLAADEIDLEESKLNMHPPTASQTMMTGSNHWGAPRSQDERFEYFQHHVARLKMWDDHGGLLFRMLKDTVQGLMDALHTAFDERYREFLEEDGGREVVGFEWNPPDEWQLPGQAEVSPPCETRATPDLIYTAHSAASAEISEIQPEIAEPTSMMARSGRHLDDAAFPGSLHEPRRRSMVSGSFESLVQQLGLSDDDASDECKIVQKLTEKSSVLGRESGDDRLISDRDGDVSSKTSVSHQQLWVSAQDPKLQGLDPGHLIRAVTVSDIDAGGQGGITNLGADAHVRSESATDLDSDLRLKQSDSTAVASASSKARDQWKRARLNMAKEVFRSSNRSLLARPTSLAMPRMKMSRRHSAGVSVSLDDEFSKEMDKAIDETQARQRELEQISPHDTQIGAVRVDEHDQAEAVVEWETLGGGGTAKSLRHGELMEEEVFISQLFRRATLLNESFLEQVTLIVEAHKPVALCERSMGHLKSLAWLESAAVQIPAAGAATPLAGGPTPPPSTQFPVHAPPPPSEDRRLPDSEAAAGAELAETSGAGEEESTRGCGRGAPSSPDADGVVTDEAVVQVGAAQPGLLSRLRRWNSAPHSSSFGSPSGIISAHPAGNEGAVDEGGGVGTPLSPPFRKSQTDSRLLLLNKSSGLLSKVSSGLRRRQDMAEDEGTRTRRSRRLSIMRGQLPATHEDASMFSQSLQRAVYLAEGSRVTLSGSILSRVVADKALQRHLAGPAPSEIGRCQSGNSTVSYVSRVTVNAPMSEEEGLSRIGPENPTQKWLQRVKRKLGDGVKEVRRRSTLIPFIDSKRGSVATRSSASGRGPLLHQKLMESVWTYHVARAPLKTKSRMREKVLEYSKREDALRPFAANILDPIRATIVCDGPRSILKAVQWFIDNSSSDSDLPSMPIVRMKNKFGMEDASEFDGYRDLLISVIHTGKRGLRIIGEIQFHDAKLHDLKRKMHKLYKVKRAERCAVV